MNNKCAAEADAGCIPCFRRFKPGSLPARKRRFMGKHDVAAYEYLSQAEYFADLFNAKIFWREADSGRQEAIGGRQQGSGK